MANRALSICLAVIRWAPVVFITAVIVWSYYAYVVEMCLFTVESIPEKVAYLLFYHPLLFLFVWVYGKTIFADPAGVPKEFYLSRQDVERFEREENEDVQREILATAGRNLPVQCRTGSGALRYCERCKCIKPDRAHHCSVCGKCILKMDHHCPWVNNCVCFSNYKFFVLFLGYALLYCLYVAATSLQYFIKFWTGAAGHGIGKFHILFLFFASLMFAISLISLFGYHCYLVAQNRSTLESFRAPIFRSGPDKDGFSLGRHGNYLEIFGDDKRLWFLPLFTSQGDGVSFPTRVVANSYHSMENTAAATPSGPSTIPPPPPPPTTQPSEMYDIACPSQVVTMDPMKTAPASGAVSQPQGQDKDPSFGDGVTYPIRTVDEDYDSLLGERQRWMEEGADDGGYYNQMATERM